MIFRISPFLLVFSLCIGTTFAAEPPIELPVTVQDVPGKAIAGASVFVNLQYGEDRGDDETIKTLKTDEHGKTTVSICPDWKSVFLLAEFPEHVGMRASWDRRQNPETKLLDSVTLTLEKGITIGGRIVDGDGNPIEGVEVLMYFQYAQGPVVSRYVGTSHNMKSDADGRWTWDRVPNDDKLVIDMHLRHPGYVDVRQEIAQKTNKNNVSLERLRDRSAVFVLQRDDRPKVEFKGVPVEGKVVEPDGNPVKGAIVYCSSDIHGNGYPITTREDGTFRFPPLREQKIALCFAVRGFQPEVRYVDVLAWSEDAKIEPVEVRLKPGKRIEIHFVDEENRPIPHVNVNLYYRDDFAGFAPLQNYNHRVSTQLHGEDRKGFVKIPERSDENGIYIWDWAPEEEFVLTFWKERFDSLYGQKFTPRTEPYTVVMKPGFEIVGRVVDEETGKPIPEYWVARSHVDSAGRTDYWDTFPQTGETFRIFTQTATKPQIFRITAEDYEPFFSKEHPAMLKNVRLDVGLRKAKLMSGTLLLPDGKPAEEINIFAGSKQEPLMEYGLPKLRSDDRDRVATTDEQGRFKLTSLITKPYILYTASEEGYAIVPQEEFEKDSAIRMKNWGGLEIRFPLSTGPRALNRIGLEHSDHPYRYWDPGSHLLVLRERFDGKSTETGRLVVEKIATGKWIVLQYDKFMANPQRPTLHSLLATRTFALEVEPGKKTEFVVPEGKAEVVGKIVLPVGWHGNYDAQDWDGDCAMIVPKEVYETMRKVHPKETPNRVCFKSAEYREKTGIMTKYSAGLDQSPDDPDVAMFRFSKVLPGEYVFSVHLRKRQKRADNGCLTNDKPMQNAGVTTFLFTVSEESENVDLGTIDLGARDSEPEFRMK